MLAPQAREVEQKAEAIKSDWSGLQMDLFAPEDPAALKRSLQDVVDRAEALVKRIDGIVRLLDGRLKALRKLVSRVKGSMSSGLQDTLDEDEFEALQIELKIQELRELSGKMDKLGAEAKSNL